jgi:F-type H+-transporting ATPase subunit epsilon
MALTQVEVVTPEGPVFSGQAEMVACRTEGGDIAFLANHMAYVGQLQAGELRVVHPEGASGAELRFEVGGGFVEVNANRVVAACDSARKLS